MNIFDLKNNLIDLNLELENYLNSKELTTYKKATAFIFSEESGEWTMSESGLGDILVHPLFYSEICPHVVDAMCEINDVFKNNLHDSELINIYKSFKNNLFLIAKKLMDLDKAEENKGLYYLTYEQIINTTKFHYFHLYCIYFDVYTLCMQDADREQYLLTLDQFEYIKERSISTKSMLIEASEVAEIKISSSLLDLLEEDDIIEQYRKILDMQDSTKASA